MGQYNTYMSRPTKKQYIIYIQVDPSWGNIYKIHEKIHAHVGATSCYNKWLILWRIITAYKLVQIIIVVVTIIIACKRASGRTRIV